MDLVHGYRPNKGKVKGNKFPDAKIRLHQDALLIIKLPDSRALRIMSRSLFLAIVLLTLPSIGSVLRGSFDVNNSDDRDINMLHSLFHDLGDEGLVKKAHKGLILSSENDHSVDDLDLLNDNAVDLVIDSDEDYKNSIPSETVDFAIAWSAWNSKFIDRVLKIDGIVVTQLSDDPLAELKALSNYRIVYIRKFDKTLIGLRKTGMVDDELNSKKNDILCGSTPEEKKLALKGLEDVLLEPPKKALVKSTLPRKMRFLPELLGDSLEDYPRRVFISDEKNGVAEWFQRNYPENQDFEIYNLDYDVKTRDSEESEKGVPVLGPAEWLSKKVKEEDYVVMKAEAEVVEEMIKKKTICLVDELFLHCKNQLENDGDEEDGNGSPRAYWQCLTLYGKLVDEGVAVHQWWK